MEPVDEDWIEYQVLLAAYKWEYDDKLKREKRLANYQNAMMEIERRRPDIMQRIILENDNANNANHEE